MRIAARRESLAEAAATERQNSVACAICMAGTRAVAFAPCGHIACCGECAAKVGACPLCKMGIMQRVPIFLP